MLAFDIIFQCDVILVPSPLPVMIIPNDVILADWHCCRVLLCNNCVLREQFQSRAKELTVK